MKSKNVVYRFSGIQVLSTAPVMTSFPLPLNTKQRKTKQTNQKINKYIYILKNTFVMFGFSSKHVSPAGSVRAELRENESALHM